MEWTKETIEAEVKARGLKILSSSDYASWIIAFEFERMNNANEVQHE